MELFITPRRPLLFAMKRFVTRRDVLRGVGASIATLGVFGGTGTVAASTDRSAGSYDRDPRVAFDATAYDSGEKKGALVENVVYDDPAACRIEDVHYIISDESGTHDVRDDASASEVGVTVARLAELYLSTTIPVAGGEAELYQQAMVNETENTPTLLIDNELTLPGNGGYTVTTLANPNLGDASDNDAYTTSRGDYDLVVVTDGSYYTAFAQRDDWRKAFNDQYIGVIDDEGGSAWQAAYLDGDGSLPTNTGNSGDVDLAFTLTADGQSEVTWTTAVGFGKRESDAVDRAVGSLQSGFDAERSASYW